MAVLIRYTLAALFFAVAAMGLLLMPSNAHAMARDHSQPLAPTVPPPPSQPNCKCRPPLVIVASPHVIALRADVRAGAG